MDEILRLLEDVVTHAELQEDFYEVETMVCVRRRGGESSDFIRMELNLTDGSLCRVTTKSTRPTPSRPASPGLDPAPLF